MVNERIESDLLFVLSLFNTKHKQHIDSAGFLSGILEEEK